MPAAEVVWVVPSAIWFWKTPVSTPLTVETLKLMGALVVALPELTKVSSGLLEDPELLKRFMTPVASLSRAAAKAPLSRERLPSWLVLRPTPAGVVKVAVAGRPVGAPIRVVDTSVTRFRMVMSMLNRPLV